MRAHASIIAVTGFLFLVSLISGLGVSWNLRLYDPRPVGKAVAGAMYGVHKFIALATVITAMVTIRRLYRGIEFTGIELAAVVVAGALFLLMLITGGLLSVGKPRNDAILTVHQVVSVLTAIPTFGAIYLLTRGRW